MSVHERYLQECTQNQGQQVLHFVLHKVQKRTPQTNGLWTPLFLRPQWGMRKTFRGRLFTDVSPPARSELLAVGGFPSATVARRQSSEPGRLHSARLTSCGTRHRCDQVRVVMSSQVQSFSVERLGSYDCYACCKRDVSSHGYSLTCIPRSKGRRPRSL
jgi:hypothetical protein